MTETRYFIPISAVPLFEMRRRGTSQEVSVLMNSQLSCSLRHVVTQIGVPLIFTHFPFQSSTRNRNVHGQTRLLYAKRHFRASHAGISSLATKQLRKKFLLSEFRALLKKT